MKRANMLYQLQFVEAEIDAKNRRLKAVLAQIGNDETVKAIHLAIDDIQQRLKSAHGEGRRLELENKGLQDEIVATEGRLYGGRVTNPKELASLEDKIRNLKQRRAHLEDDLITNMLEIEETETELARAQAQLDQETAGWTASQARFAEERGALEKDLSALRADQAALRAAVSPGDLDTFEDLRRRKGGQGVVKIVDGTCQGCGVSVATSRAQSVTAGNDLVFCGSCERILCK